MTIFLLAQIMVFLIGIKTPYAIIVMIQDRNLVSQTMRYGVFLQTETIISGPDTKEAFQ